MTRQQLGDLVIESEDSMYRIAKSILFQDADCADAIQEAITKAFENIDTLRKDSYAKTWLIRILINECYAIIKRQSRFAFADDMQDSNINPAMTYVWKIIAR